MTKFFLSVYDYFSQRRKRLFILLLCLTGLFGSMAYLVRFKEDISGFLPDTNENKRINTVYRYVVTANKITVFCSGADATDQTKNIQIEAIERLAKRLQSLDSTYVKDVFYKVESSEMMSVTSFIVNNIPYFLDEADYRRMDTLFTRESVARCLDNVRRNLLSPVGMALKESFLTDPFRLTNQAMQNLQDFRADRSFQLFDDYIFTDDGDAMMLIDCAIPVSETVRNAELTDSLKVFMNDVEREMDGKIAMKQFGPSEIAIGNASQIKKDTLFSSLLAVILIFALLIYAFRNTKQILLVFVSTFFGGLFALALLYLFRGEVSVIAVGISSIMFGIAINYPLHFIDHYNHTPHPRIVIKEIIEPLTIGNITTVGAFLSLVFIGSDAMTDLGLFASLLLVGTILFVLFFLPHLLVSSRPAVHRAETSFLSRLASMPFEQNRWVVTVVFMLTVVFCFFSSDSRFETNMQKINYMTDAQQQEYTRMTNLLNQNRHVLYYVTEGVELDKTLEANEQFLPVLDTLLYEQKISSAASISRFYPSVKRQAEQLARWNMFWDTRRDSVLVLLDEEAHKSGFKPDAFRVFREMISRKWETAGLSYFDQIRNSLAKNYILEKDGKSLVINMLYTDAAQVAVLEEKLNISGSPSIAFDAGSITRRMIASLSDNFNYVLFVCGFIVFVFLFFTMGRLELSLIAFAPLVLSWIWILGLMNLFDIRFNIVNIILATFIFGQGDDYTIFITEGLMYEYTYKRRILASYKQSIVLSALIMFIGMGMLIFAKHPALHSLAEVTMVGMVSVVVMSFILPPFLFRLLTLHKGQKRLMSVTLKNLAATCYAFLTFLVMTSVITLFGWFLFATGRATERRKQIYHRVLQRVARFVIFRVPQVKTSYRNPSGETFEKPAVIICNHQSHLDLMCLLMFTPKMVILTNDRAWNSPFYGRMIRYADFYPVSNGIENALGRLEELIRRGYSIVIFPEGTRSPDCSILRFHRGAFYLAEKLHTDILPVLLHGVGHVLPKQEFMLRKGEIHIEVMERITPDDTRFSAGYSPRSREVRHLYQTRYESLRREVETYLYYIDLVWHNYIYKGPTIERTVRKTLRNRQRLATLFAQLPDTGRIVIENSGYGEIALLIALVKKCLQVIGIEPDDDKRAVAVGCGSIPGNLIYMSDKRDLNITESDICIVCD